MRRNVKISGEKKVNKLLLEIRNNYPNLYQSIGSRYVRHILTGLYNPASQKRKSIIH